MSYGCNECGKPTTNPMLMCIECREKNLRFLYGKGKCEGREFDIALHLTKRFQLWPATAIKTAKYVVGIETRAFFRGKNSR